LQEKEHKKKEDIRLDLNHAYNVNEERKSKTLVDDKLERERLNKYYKELNDKLQKIDDEIEYRNQLKRKDFQLQVEDMKSMKNQLRKQNKQKENEEKQKQKDEEEFMKQIMEQKRLLLIEAIRSLGLDEQDLPKGTGVSNKIN